MGRMIRGIGFFLGMIFFVRVYGVCRKWLIGIGLVFLVGLVRFWRKEIW